LQNDANSVAANAGGDAAGFVFGKLTEGSANTLTTGAVNEFTQAVEGQIPSGLGLVSMPAIQAIGSQAAGALALPVTSTLGVEFGTSVSKGISDALKGQPSLLAPAGP
jgi:hypothetical protein